MQFKRKQNYIYMIMDADVHLIGEIKNRDIHWRYLGKTFLSDDQRETICNDFL